MENTEKRPTFPKQALLPSVRFKALALTNVSIDQGYRSGNRSTAWHGA